jgi:hypothetical protein
MSTNAILGLVLVGTALVTGALLVKAANTPIDPTYI